MPNSTNTTLIEGSVTVSEINFPGQSIHYYMSESDDLTCEYTANGISVFADVPTAVFQPNWTNGRYSDGWLVTNDWEMELKKSLPDAITSFSRWLNIKKGRLWSHAGTSRVTAKPLTADANVPTAGISGDGVNPGM